MGRKKKTANKPYNPATDQLTPERAAQVRGQLGIPTPERVAKSNAGFDVQQLAIGHDREGGVMRSRERAMLTPLALLQDRLEEYLQGLRASNQEIPNSPRISMTPSDEVIAGNPYVVHDYITTHKEVKAKSIDITKYEGSPGGGDLHRLPLSDPEFSRRAFYAWVQENAPLAVTTVLEQVCEQCNPEVMARALGKEPQDAITKADIGRYWAKKQKSDRDAVNSADGALGVVSDILAELHMNYITLKRRKKALEKIALEHSKKMHYC